MKRRTLAICIVLGLLVFALSFVTKQHSVKAQSLTATPTLSGDFGLVTITGNVQDVYGPTQICCEATAGASITVASSGLHGSSGGSAITDASGNYSVSNIHLYDTDTVTVTVSKAGFPTTSTVRSGIATSTNKVFSFTLIPTTPTPYYSPTPRPGCGTQMVVTSTPSPTFTPTFTPTVIPTLTRTATSCSPIYITATPPGPTSTPTRTPTLTPVGTNNDVPYPDLTVSSVTYVGSSPTCANNPKVQVIITNIGAYPANSSFEVTLAGGVAQVVNGLAAGQSVTLIFAASSATATVDSTNRIVETNESNNSLTGNFGVPTQAPTCTPTTGLTPTRTPTGPTPTFTRTATPSLTPTVQPGVCSPVTSSITAPFTYDGAAILCWQSTNLGTYINSWNTTSVTLNGVNVTNLYVAAGSYPAKIGGYWYVGYNSAVSYGHFETK
ncbi:MAG: CARDB domain-containing protein [Anaerolineales bacterium]